MDWLGAALNVTEQALILINTLESKRDRNRLLELRQNYYEEKSRVDPNMALLDDLEHSLFLLCNATRSPENGGSSAAPASNHAGTNI